MCGLAGTERAMQNPRLFLSAGPSDGRPGPATMSFHFGNVPERDTPGGIRKVVRNDYVRAASVSPSGYHLYWKWHRHTNSRRPTTHACAIVALTHEYRKSGVVPEPVPSTKDASAPSVKHELPRYWGTKAGSTKDPALTTVPSLYRYGYLPTRYKCHCQLDCRLSGFSSFRYTEIDPVRVCSPWAVRASCVIALRARP